MKKVFVLLLFLVLSSSISLATLVGSISNPFHNWSLDENLNDSAGSVSLIKSANAYFSNNFTNGNASVVLDGGGSLAFNGSLVFSFNYNPATLNMWVNFNNSNDSVVIWQSLSSDELSRMVLKYNVNTHTLTTRVAAQENTSTIVLDNSTWYMFTWISRPYDNYTLVYINAELALNYSQDSIATQNYPCCKYEGVAKDIFTGYTTGHLPQDSIHDEILIYNYSITSDGIKELYGTSPYVENIYISEINLSVCDGVNDYLILNISTYDEESTSNKINTTIEGNLQLYSPYGLALGNYTIVSNDAFDTGVCLNNGEWTTIYNNFLVTSNLYSDAEQGFTQRWYLTNLSVERNQTKNVSIYNRISTTDISDLLATVRNPQYNYLSGVYVTLQRYYPGLGEWIGVQMDRSDEFGQVFFNIREEDTDYRLLFTGSGNEVYDYTDTIKFICSDNVCEVTFQVDTSVSVSVANPTYTWDFDNTTKVGELSWVDTTGVTNAVRLLVEQQTYGDSVVICNKMGYSASGSLECNMSGYSGTIKVQAYSSASPEDSFFITYIYDLRDQLVDLIDENDGVIFSLAIVVTVIGLSLISPVMVIMGSIVGLLFVTLLGLTTWLNFGFVMGGTVIALILAYLIGGRGG